MNPNLLEQFLGPSSDFFRFNTNDINILVTPIDKKTSLLTKRNIIRTTTNSATLAVLNQSLTCATLNDYSTQPDAVERASLDNKSNNWNTTNSSSNANRPLASASASKISLKDKYKHVKSTIPPPRPVNPAPATKPTKNQLRSKSSNNIKDMIVKDADADDSIVTVAHNESCMSFSGGNKKTLSSENIFNESICNDENENNFDENCPLNCSTVFGDKVEAEISSKFIQLI
jgi:hypothetical protein